ncbi:MAG TPA: hypothetical protein VK453_10855 [Micromonosporaceae bacterium]|nr:hypothetical protein [Micromonosporaceae bacterium]
MRHVASFFISPIIAVLIYLLIGIANVRAATGLDQVDGDRSLGYANLGLAVGCLAVAGALYSVLVLARLSPLGTVLAGLALLGVGLWAWFARESFLDSLPSGLPGVRGAVHAGAGALTIALSIPLLLTLFSPRRWRRHGTPKASAPTTAAPAYPTPQGYPEQPAYAQHGGYEPQGYEQQGYSQPGYEQQGYGQPGYGQHGGYEPTPGYATAPGYPSDDTPTYQPPSYGSTLGGTEGHPRPPQS